MWLNSIDISILWGNMEIPKVPNLDMPAIFYIPPATMIGYVIVVDDGDELDTPEIDDQEGLVKPKDVVYVDLDEFEGDIVQMIT